MNDFNVISVSQLNRYIKAIIEENPMLNNIFVTGEISNFKNHYSSGHFYMTLKDESAAVSAVMYRQNAQRVKFSLQDGLNVIVRGRVALYEKTGQYQIIIDDIQPQGIGALALAFEQLKEKLLKEGLFDEKHKKTIPKYPAKIGVVTSATGAAIQDILNILSRRFPLSEVILCPVEVQGVNAAASIVKAIERFNVGNYADVLIVGRGGGSIEDLWAFNEEIVARAVFNSKIPIISAVGHETDFTICDFVADLRAPTPSAAAELCVPDINEEMQNAVLLRQSAYKYLNYKLENEKTRLKHIQSNKVVSNPLEIINLRRIETDRLNDSLVNAYKNYLNEKSSELKVTLEKLDSLNPIKVLNRGFSYARKSNDKVIKSVSDVKKGEKITLTVCDGSIDCEVL